MLNLKRILFAITLTSLLFSCKRNEVVKPVNTIVENPLLGIPKVKEKITFYGGTAYNVDYFEYDFEGRISSVITNGNDITSYFFSETHVRVTSLSDTFVYLFNNDGLAVNVTKTYGNDSTTNPGIISYETVYNNGYKSEVFIQNSWEHFDWRELYFVDNTNIVRYELFYGASDEYYRHWDYEYYYDKVNTIGNYNKGIYYEGKSSTSLLKRTTTEQVGFNNDTYNYTYEFDSEDRVYKEFVNGDTTRYTQYTYY